MDQKSPTDSGVLGSLLANSESPSVAPPPGPVTVASISTPEQLQMPTAPHITATPGPNPSITKPPVTTNISLNSSGPEPKTTLTMSTIKPPVPSPAPKVTSSPAPLATEPHTSGKPRAFLSMMPETKTPSTTRKQQSSKKGQSGGQTRGHSSKSNTGVKETTPRTSQRAIKRPRYYDDDDDNDQPKSGGSGKKTKAQPKSSKTNVNKKPTTNPIKTTSAAKDLGRWRPTDDLMLISAVQQSNDLTAVYLGIKFSCRFTLKEIEERWHALLYDPQISHIAIEAMRGLHPGVVTMALNNALWSQEEEVVLAKIPSSDAGHLETFQKVLREHPAVFHACRTATSLHHHWVLMGHYSLLNDQKVQLIPPGDNVTDFTDAEQQKTDAELMKARDVREEALEQELMASDRVSKREIASLETDLPLWRTVLDTPATSELGPNDLAVFRGKVVEFRMNKPSVTFGRATPINKVDFDLSLEGPAYKISRHQASVHLSPEGEFLLHNEGRRALFVEGKAVPSGRSVRLESNQTIEVASMAFLVLLNSNPMVLPQTTSSNS